MATIFYNLFALANNPGGTTGGTTGGGHEWWGHDWWRARLVESTTGGEHDWWRARLMCYDYRRYCISKFAISPTPARCTLGVATGFRVFGYTRVVTEHVGERCGANSKSDCSKQFFPGLSVVAYYFF